MLFVNISLDDISVKSDYGSSISQKRENLVTDTIVKDTRSSFLNLHLMWVYIFVNTFTIIFFLFVCGKH